MVVSIDLSGKVAFVTGAGKGIGRACALMLAKAGADVVIPDLDLAGAEKTASNVQSLGRESLPIKGDVSRPEDVDRIFEDGLRKFGRIDILVNNAGVGSSVRKPYFEQALESWRRTIDVDLIGLWLCCKAATNDMMKRKSGKIVNIASIAGKVALRLEADYTAAKAAVIRLTEAMALEVGQYNINVNAVAPGSTLTEMTKSLYADRVWRENMLKFIPLGRPAETEEIASAVLFVCSDLATYITGHTIVVDGGWTAGAQIRDV
ncbi:MAG: glucose 1-dehydrogenase [Candidatus Bathyarchaeia archaeon]|jgi:NAD(P)-dependent dehydrogenase (short-subunit alcohol dehydrogenase family)